MKKIFTLKSTLISFISGAIGGTIGDICHVYTKTDGYPFDQTTLLNSIPPIPFLSVEVPLWVPLLMGSAGFFFMHAVRIINVYGHGFFDYENRAAIHTNASGVIFVALYAFTGFYDAAAGGMKDFILLFLVVGFWWISDRHWQSLLLGLGVAVLGTAFEIFIVHHNVFYYLPAHSNFFGVPSWLPTLYVAAGVAVRPMARML